MMRGMRSDPTNASPTDPYVHTAEFGEVSSARSRWPIVLGSLCLAYGVIGMCVQGGSILFANFGGSLLKAQGVDIEMPPEMVLAMNVQGAVLVPLGVILSLGGVLLLMRRRVGAKLVLVWAAARVCMAVAGLIWGMMTVDATVDYSRGILESMARSSNPEMAKAVQSELDKFDAVKARSDGIRNLVLATLGFSILPCVVGFMLTSTKRRAEVAAWGLNAPSA